MNDYHSNEATYTYTDIFRDCPKRARPRARRDCPWPAKNCAGATLFWEKERFPRAPFVENLARFSLGSARGVSFSQKKHPSHIQTHPDRDGAYWEYEYDGRLRLTKADRDNSSDELQKRYTYTYDDGDNMLTKVVYDAVGESTTTTAFEYTNANELAKQTVGGTTTNFTYDKYGRMTGKTQGGYSATHAYRYGQMLYSVTSDFPGEGTVTYEYGGDLKRRSRTVSGTTTNYNWDAGYTMINEEDSGGDLTMTYIGKLADVSGDDPSTGTWRYYSADERGSARRLRDASKSSLGQYEYTPYGEIYSETGATLTQKFASMAGDDTADLYYTPSGYYNPALARSTSRTGLSAATQLDIILMGGSIVLSTYGESWDNLRGDDFIVKWAKWIIATTRRKYKDEGGKVTYQYDGGVACVQKRVPRDKSKKGYLHSVVSGKPLAPIKHISEGGDAGRYLLFEVTLPGQENPVRRWAVLPTEDDMWVTKKDLIKQNTEAGEEEIRKLFESLPEMYDEIQFRESEGNTKQACTSINLLGDHEWGYFKKPDYFDKKGL